MAQQKFDRKDLKHDAFQDAMFDLVGYVYERRLWFIGGALAVLLIGAGVGGYLFWDSYSSRVQSHAFFEAAKLLGDEKVDPDTRMKNTQVALQAFLESYPRSRLAPAAWLNLARLAWEQKHYDQAAANFQRALDLGATTPEQRAVALSGLGRALEQQSKYAEAQAVYNQLPDKPFGDLKAASLARIAQLMGNPAQARKEYEKIVQGQSDSALSSWAKRALDALP